MLANVESQPYCVPLLRSSRPMTYQMQANQCATITNAQSISSSSAKEFSRNLCVVHDSIKYSENIQYLKSHMTIKMVVSWYGNESLET